MISLERQKALYNNVTQWISEHAFKIENFKQLTGQGSDV